MQKRETITYFISINFIKYFFDGCFITHSILRHGKFQFVSCNIPGEEFKNADVKQLDPLLHH